MVHAERFSYQLKAPDDVREPFRAAVAGLATQPSALMIFTPSIETTEGVTHASVLVVDDRSWHVVVEREGGASVTGSPIESTVLVEMTVVLLLGRLKFDYATRHDVRSVVIEFNTVMEHLYHAAAEHILGAMKGRSGAAAVDRKADLDLLHSVPLKFRNSILRFAPPAERIQAVAYWPAIVTRRKGAIENELSPESAVILCDRELLVVSEEKLIPPDRPAHRFRIGLVNKHGSVAIHGLLSRLAEFRFGGIGAHVSLDLVFQVDPVMEIISLVMPAEQKAPVVDILRQALRLKREPA